MKIGGLEKFTLIDYPGKTACIIYTIGCNFRCPYCHNPELVDETTETIITEKEIFDFLRKRRDLLDGAVITGGEPTLQTDLLDFMKEIKKMGFLVKLDSNGTRPELLKTAVEKKLVNYIAMDIKAPLEKYQLTAARPVDLEAIRKSIKLLLELPPDIEYEFRTTVVKSLLAKEDIAKIGREIEGARRYYLQKFIPSKILNPQFRTKVTYSDEEFKQFKKIMNRYVQYCGIR